MEKHLELLGYKAMDKVTKMEGIITSISFDLFGCIQVILTPAYNSNSESQWFDLRRVTVLDYTRVMEYPDFKQGYIAEGKKGADCYKPIP